MHYVLGLEVRDYTRVHEPSQRLPCDRAGRPVFYHTAERKPLTPRRLSKTEEKKREDPIRNFTTKFWLQCLDVLTGMLAEYLCPSFAC